MSYQRAATRAKICEVEWRKCSSWRRNNFGSEMVEQAWVLCYTRSEAGHAAALAVVSTDRLEESRHQS